MPGFIFQSIVIGGGYGTGRELVEFFMLESPAGGLLAMALATLVWSAVMAVSFEIGRMGKKYDYRSFIGALLGRGWIIYEAAYMIGMVLVISVLGSAAGQLLHDMLGIPAFAGILIMIISVGVLVFYSTSIIEKVLSFWSICLYAAFFTLVIVALIAYSNQILENISVFDRDSNWALGGIKYAAYNIGLVPAMIYVVRHFDNRQEALVSGAMAGVLGMVPGLFIYLSMVSAWPDILEESVPVNYLLTTLGMPSFLLVFQIILLGTFIETGVGLIHGLNERIAHAYQENKRQMPQTLRVAVALIILTGSIFLADTIGLVTLIAKGYGFITWGFLIAFVIPVLTIGIHKLLTTK